MALDQGPHRRMTPGLTAVAAMDRNQGIGRGGRIPWHLPEDFAWFKRLTMGGVLVMGRKTYESIGKPLPGRLTVVVSRGPALPGVEMLREAEALDPGQYGGRPVFVVGGAEIYRALLPRCDRLFLSLVEGEFEADTHFPPFGELYEDCGVVWERPGFAVHEYRRRPGPRGITSSS